MCGPDRIPLYPPPLKFVNLTSNDFNSIPTTPNSANTSHLAPPPMALELPSLNTNGSVRDVGMSAVGHQTGNLHDRSQDTGNDDGRGEELHDLDSDQDEFGEWRGRKLRIAGVGSWPCDSIELERQEAQVFNTEETAHRDPFLGPVYEVLRDPSEPPKILDIATGTGMWAIEMAELFPLIDNTPMQEKMVPKNCEFEIVDLDSPLPYPSSSFTILHLRFAHLRVLSFPFLLKESLRLLKPGGLLLIFDSSSTPILADGNSTLGVRAWSDAFSRGLRVAGMKSFDLDGVISEGLFRGMEVGGNDMRVPIGHGIGRMGQLGKIHMINTKAYLEAARHVMIEYGGYTDAEVDILSQAYMSDITEHAMYTQYNALWIRKPEQPPRSSL